MIEMTMEEIKEQARNELRAKGITFPRKKHSHRCLKCGEGVYCYKQDCTKPQRVDCCQWCW